VTWCLRGGSSALPLVAGLLLIAGVFLMPVTGGFTRIPGDLGDARFNSIILEHCFRWLVGREDALWSPGFFFPYRDTLAFSDNHFGSVAVYGLARLAGLGREGAYLFWFSVGVLVDFAATFWALRRYGFGALASICGAMLFAAGLPTVFKTAHAQLTYRAAIPLAFWCINEWLAGADSKRLFVGILLTTWQFFCSIYLGVFLLFALVLLGFAHTLLFYGRDPSMSVLVGRLRKDLYSAPWLAFTVVLAVGALGLMLWKYAAVSAEYGFSRSLEDIYSMLPTPGSYLVADFSVLYGRLGQGVEVAMRHEHQMFVGVVAGALILVGASAALARNASAVVRIALVVLVGLVMFTMNFGGRSLYWVAASIPGISSVRAVARVVLVMLWPAAILLACGVESGVACLRRRALGGYAVGFGWCCLALMVAEVAATRHYSAAVSDWRRREESVRSRLPSNVPADSLLLVAWGGSEQKLLAELDGMMVAQDLGIKTLNGYSGNFPSQAWRGSAFGNDCTGARKRLATVRSSAEEARQEQWLAKVEGHVLTVALGPCSPEQVVPDDLTPEVIRGVRLEPEVDGLGNAKVVVTNGADQPLSSITRLGPVRLSWRFVRAAQEGRVGWDARREVDLYLGPGESKVVTFVVTPPSARGDYRFEVSLVQEGVRWLHENGMRIGVAPFRVP